MGRIKIVRSADHLVHFCADKWAVSLVIPTLLVAVCGVCVWAPHMRCIFVRTRMHKRRPDTIVLMVFAWILLLLVLGTNGAKQRINWHPVGNHVNNGKPSARESHAMVTGPDGSIYMFGGTKYYGSDANYNELFKQDIHTGEWHVIQPFGSVRPSSVFGHAMTVCGNNIYLFGGWTSQGGKR